MFEIFDPLVVVDLRCICAFYTARVMSIEITCEEVLKFFSDSIFLNFDKDHSIGVFKHFQTV